MQKLGKKHGHLSNPSQNSGKPVYIRMACGQVSRHLLEDGCLLKIERIVQKKDTKAALRYRQLAISNLI